MSGKAKKRKVAYSSICRTCLTELLPEADSYSVFAKIPGFKPIAEIVRDFTTVPVDATDNLPKNVCPECRDNFLQIAEFRELIRASHLNLMMVTQNQSNTAKSKSTQLDNNKDTVKIEIPEKVDPKADNPPSIEYKLGGLKIEVPPIEDNDLENPPIINDQHEKDSNTGDHSQYLIEDYKQKSIQNQSKDIQKHNVKMYNQNKPKNYSEYIRKIYLSEINESEEDSTDIEVMDDNVDNQKTSPEEEEEEQIELRIDESGTEDDDDGVCVQYLEEPNVKNDSHHPTSPTYDCKCGQSFIKVYSYINHIKCCDVFSKNEGHEEKKITCNACQKTFSSQSDLNKHWKLYCSKSLRSNAEPEVHSKWHPLRPEFKCMFCSMNFENNMFLVSHVRSEHCHFKCKLCSKGFTTESNLDLHVKFSHQSNMLTDCPLCEKSVQAKFLNKHLTAHAKKKAK